MSPITRIRSLVPPVSTAGQLRAVLSAAASSSQQLGRVTAGAAGRAKRLAGRPVPRTVLIGGVVIAGTALAVPLARTIVRRAAARLATRRDLRSAPPRGLDPLTSLPNRADAEWWLVRRLDLARARKQRLAVLVLDIDDFAGCNDSYGRAAGDHVLQVTAARLQSQLRTGDMACRTGNDTFMVLMDVTGPDHLIAKIGERVVAAVSEPISFADEPITVRASIGFAISQDREADPQLLLGRADRAVIQAKASQRPIVQF